MEGFIVVFSSILTIGIYFIISYYVAKEFKNIAKMKGYEENKYFWYCFWLSIIGYLMIIALPVKVKKPQPQSQPQINQSTINNNSNN